MRNITITRRKTFVASLNKMKVYVESSDISDIIINGTPCRKLGTLKNGETKSFQIDNEERRLYVIADKLSRNYCNDFYTVPAGETDLFVSGKNNYNPASGNAFRFDGIQNNEVVENRKKGTKKGLIILIFSIILGVIIGLISNLDVFEGEPKAKTFKSSGFSITLNDDFMKVSNQYFDICYGSEDVAVFVNNESISDFAEDIITAKHYAELVIDANNFDFATVKEEDGLCSFNYTADSEEGEKYKYYCYSYKANNDFWLVQFAVDLDSASEFADDINLWAKSVKIED